MNGNEDSSFNWWGHLLELIINQEIVTFEPTFSIVRTEKELGRGVVEEEEEESLWRSLMDLGWAC